MTEREALKLALKCAERCESIDGMYSWTDTITAIKEALAQPEQEPKVWGMPNASGDILDVISPEEHARLEGGYTVALYTTPPQRKPLLVGKESAEFAEWFNAYWIGDGEQGETIPTKGKEYDDYLSKYTLAFGAWMAAKQAAHGIKGDA